MSAAAINTAPTPAAGAAGQASSATGVGATHGAQTSGLPAIFEAMLATLTARFHDFGSNAQMMAIKQMSLMIRRESTVMSFSYRLRACA